MHYYKLWATSPEADHSATVLHEQVFTNEALEKLFREACAKAGAAQALEERAQYLTWSQDPALAEDTRTMWRELANEDYVPQVWEVWNAAVELMYKEHGFQPIHYTAVIQNLNAWSTC